GDKLLLTSHKSFVVLECVDKLLSMGYKPSEIIIDLDNEYDIYCKDLYIKCFEWNHEEDDNVVFNVDAFKSITYSSRLISGVIERRTLIKTFDGFTYNLGIFENETRKEKYQLSNTESIDSNDFIIKSGVATKYIGKSEIIIIPEGVRELSPCLFWDNQIIREVKLPKSLINISGDTFYNCNNLEKVNIPINCKFMGNNPFAGCPNIKISNESKYFNDVDGVLYNNDFTKLIYYPISSKRERYVIDSRCKIIGKHSFFLCNSLKEVEIPESVIKLENNPFSGCTQITLNNKSSYYHIEDSVIYDRDYSSIIGCLNSISTDCLVLKNVRRICRNSFWNCKGIKRIILPSTLEDIGYNPFVSCSNIEFESNSSKYIVYNNALYTRDKSKLVCYPAKFAVGDVYLPNETITLERGAFSGCGKLTNIHLHNVSIISKTCFTNCNLLEYVYCSDLVAYIGEWAFAHCNNLKEISIYKDCFVDNNVTLNSPTKITIRTHLSNYVIESDNIYTLKSMVKSYKGKIDSILIDPPYNSHIDYIGYKDGNYEEGYYNFMYERLNLAYNLLSDNGYLVINIDEGEVKGLTSLVKDIFGKSNVMVSKWKKLHPKFDMNRDVNPNKKRVLYEYIILCKKNKDSILNNIMQPYFEGDEFKEKESLWPKIWDCFGTNSSAKDEIAKLFGDRRAFSTPKPVKLIKEFVRATTNKNSIVLDFFAGSGTVGQAVVELNKEDNGNRKVILVSNNESNICRNITLKRMNMISTNIEFID
nr:leucine-rich repeat protein [Acholeplasmatales bacterium]